MTITSLGTTITALVVGTRGVEAAVPSGFFRATVAAIACMGLCGTAACAQRVRHPRLTDERDRPHLTWVIESVGRDADETVVCDSEGGKPCVLRASTAPQRAMATVHVYLHAISGETMYTGTIRVGFMADAAHGVHETRVAQRVKPGQGAVNVSVTGFVTEIPGTYNVRISVVAQTAGSTAPIERDAIVLVADK